MAYFIIENGDWLETEKPTQGQRYRFIDSSGGVLESFWSELTELENDYKITRLALRQRFTFSERVTIETAAETDAAVRVMLKDQDSATFIDLSRQDTIDGVNMLASKGLITEARASEILTAPVQEIERYKG